MFRFMNSGTNNAYSPYYTGYTAETAPADYAQAWGLQTTAPIATPATTAGLVGGMAPPSSTTVYGQAPQTLAKDTAAGNLAAAPDMETLANLINQINEQNQQNLNKGRLGPQGENIQNTLLGNVAAGAAGQLTPSELRVLGLSAAERGANQGFGVDSSNISADFTNRYLRTVYDRQQDALKNYSTLLADNPSAPLYGMEKNLVSPDLYASTADAQAKLQYAYWKALLDAQENAMNRAAAARPTGGTTRAPVATTPSYAPMVPGTTTGGGGGGTRATTDNYVPLEWANIPGGTSGSSIFGGVNIGGGNTGDIFDPSGLSLTYPDQFPAYGTMPDYSVTGIDPMAAALGGGDSTWDYDWGYYDLY